MKKEEYEIGRTIMGFFKALLTLVCIAMTIGLLVIDQKSVGTVFADIWWTYGFLLAINVGELIKRFITKR